MALSPFLCRHCIYKAVAGLAECFRAQCDAEPSAGTLVSCLAPLCTVTPFHQAHQAPSVEPLMFAVSWSLPWQHQHKSSLSDRCRQNESPALISLCLAVAQTLKLPEMGRK